VTSPTQRPLPDNTQHSQETYIHAPGGIQTHIRSKRAAAEPSLRPRGHWDRPTIFWGKKIRKKTKGIPCFFENNFLLCSNTLPLVSILNHFYPFHIFILYCGQTNFILYSQVSFTQRLLNTILSIHMFHVFLYVILFSYFCSSFALLDLMSVSANNCLLPKFWVFLF